MSAPSPVLSVLIATHDRRRMLERCLAALAAQSEDPAAFEVVVADDGSSDGTAAALAERRTAFALRVLSLARGGKAAALNAAIEAARGEVCLFIDDDVIASPQLVAEHLAAHRREPRTLGVGAITQQPTDARDWYAHAFARGWNQHYEDMRRDGASWLDCYGANLSAPRAMLLEVGGVAALRTGEDLELGFRLSRAGGVPAFLPNAHGVHDDQKGGRRMLADLRRQGVAHVELAQRHPEVAAELLPWPETAVPVEIPLRRALIFLRVPPRALAAAGRLLPGEGRKALWFQFVRRFAFWRAVRGATSRERWRRVTA